MKSLALCLTALFLGNAEAGLNDGLVAYYKFSKCSGAESNGGAPLTKHGTAQCIPTPAKKGMYFHGDGDYLVAQSGLALSFSTGASISVLVNPATTQNSTAYLVNKWVMAQEDKALGLASDNRVFFYMFDCMNTQLLLTTKGIEPGRWTHIVGTYDGAYARLFLDGTLESSVPVESSCTIRNSFSNLYIGQNPGRLPWEYHSFTGGLDEVRIYDRPLSEKEIENLFLSYQ